MNDNTKKADLIIGGYGSAAGGQNTARSKSTATARLPAT